MRKEIHTQKFKVNTVKWYTDESKTTIGQAMDHTGQEIGVPYHNAFVRVFFSQKYLQSNDAWIETWKETIIAIHSDSEYAIKALNSYVIDPTVG